MENNIWPMLSGAILCKEYDAYDRMAEFRLFNFQNVDLLWRTSRGKTATSELKPLTPLNVRYFFSKNLPTKRSWHLRKQIKHKYESKHEVARSITELTPK